MNSSLSPASLALRSLLDLDENPNTTEELESILKIIDLDNSGFKSFITDLLDTQFWRRQDLRGNIFKPLCLNLSADIDRLALIYPEPAYHSRKHFKDVCLMLSYFLKQQQVWALEEKNDNPWFVSQEEMWALLLAAICHDFSHPGLINQTLHEIEQRSLDLLQVSMTNSKIDALIYESVLKVISPWILATDPAVYVDHINKITQGIPEHQMCLAMLLIESDLACSVLPHKGLELACRLSQEWAIPYPDKSIDLKNQLGYFSFLSRLQFLSPQAVAANFPKILNYTLSQLKTDS